MTFRAIVFTTTLICSVLISSVTYAGINDGLIAHYTFDGTSGAVIDSTGSFSGTNHGATRGVSGRIGNAFQFSGVSSTFVDTLPAGDIPATNTVSFWMNPTHTTRLGGQLFGSVQSINTGPSGLVFAYTEIDSSDPNSTLHTHQESVWANYYHDLGRVVGSRGSFPLDTWTHMTYTYDATANDVNIYANGSLAGSGSFDSSLSAHERTLMFGSAIHAQAQTYGFNGKIDDVKIWDRALSSSEIGALSLNPDNYVHPPQPDPVEPPQHTSQHNFIVGAQPTFQWDGFTVGLDFSLSIPTLDPIEYHPSITYPSEPFTPELSPWETSFGTNSWWLGPALSAVAPVEFNAIELTGTARLSGDATAEAGVYLEDGQNNADIGASIGAGLNLGLTLEAQSGLLDLLPNVIQDLIPTTFDFNYPIVGTPIFATPEVPVSLGFGFDIDGFIQNLSVATGEPTSYFEDTVDVLGIPMNFVDTNNDNTIDNVSVTIGASASIYAETSATAGLDFYFLEVDDDGSPVDGTSIFETWGNIWNQTVEVTNETVSVSDTGEVNIDVDGLFTMITGSPVWMSTVIDVTELTNLLAFEADFLSELGAEGLLQVYWDGELIATVDERLTGDGLQSYIFALPESYDDGFHQFALRLDSFTEIASSIQVDSVTTGYLAAVPEPASLALIMLGMAGMGWHRRRA